MMTPGNRTSCLVVSKGSSAVVSAWGWQELSRVVVSAGSSVECLLVAWNESILMGWAMDAKLFWCLIAVLMAV